MARKVLNVPKVPKPRMKPKFIIPLNEQGDRVLLRLDKLIRSGKFPVTGSVLKQHAFVQIPRENRSLLSPYLNLTIKKVDGQCYLMGRFSPHPHVWTGFMAIYGFLIFLGMCGLVYGWAQQTIGESAVAMWLFPASLLACAFVYGAAVIGQGLTAHEMYTLRVVVDRAVENCVLPPEEAGAES